MKNIKSQRGSIALISLLLISVISMILVIGASETSISTSYQYMNNSNSKSGYYLAEGCLEESIVRLESDSDFSGTTINASANETCTIEVTGNSVKTVLITVDSYNYRQKFEASVVLTPEGVINNADLSAWSEI